MHLRDPVRDVAVTAEEVTEEDRRRRVVGQAWQLQPWYADQAYSIDDWARNSPIVVLIPRLGDGDGEEAGRGGRWRCPCSGGSRDAGDQTAP